MRKKLVTSLYTAKRLDLKINQKALLITSGSRSVSFP